MIVQRLFSYRSEISKLIKKSGLNWDEKEKMNDALEGMISRKRAREYSRQRGVNKAYNNAISSNSESYHSTDDATDRAAELARRAVEERNNAEAVKRRFKKIVSGRSK